MTRTAVQRVASHKPHAFQERQGCWFSSTLFTKATQTQTHLPPEPPIPFRHPKPHPRPRTQPDTWEAGCEAAGRPQVPPATLLVNVAAFFESLSCGSCFGHSLATCQVHQADFTDLLSRVLVVGNKRETAHVRANAHIYADVCSVTEGSRVALPPQQGRGGAMGICDVTVNFFFFKFLLY